MLLTEALPMDAVSRKKVSTQYRKPFITKIHNFTAKMSNFPVRRAAKTFLKIQSSHTETLSAKFHLSPSDINCDSEDIREMFHSSLE